MKNRKLLIAVFLCFAMIITGVGYAALSGHLKINGTATFKQNAAQEGFIENITFANPKVLEETGGSAQNEQNRDTASIGETAQEAVFTVQTLAVQGEYVTFSYELTNTNVVPADISIKALHDDGQTPNPQSNFSSSFRVDYIKITSQDGSKTSTFFGGTNESEYNQVHESATYRLGVQETATVTVQVSLLVTPSTDIATQGFRLHLVATSVDAITQN